MKDTKAHTNTMHENAAQGAAEGEGIPGGTNDRIKQEVATFKLFCQSRDGKLCLFEDADGHLTAVRADRLA